MHTSATSHSQVTPTRHVPLKVVARSPNTRVNTLNTQGWNHTPSGLGPGLRLSVRKEISERVFLRPPILLPAVIIRVFLPKGKSGLALITILGFLSKNSIALLAVSFFGRIFCRLGRSAGLSGSSTITTAVCLLSASIDEAPASSSCSSAIEEEVPSLSCSGSSSPLKPALEAERVCALSLVGD